MILLCHIADIGANQRRDNGGRLRLGRENRAGWEKTSPLLQIRVWDNRSNVMGQARFFVLYCEGTPFGGGIRIAIPVGQCPGRSSVMRPSVPTSSVTSENSELRGGNVRYSIFVVAVIHNCTTCSIACCNNISRYG